MKYFEDMTTKWGFSDGEAIPSEACVTRKVYVAAINTRAMCLGSEYRAVEWDRWGCHNYCLIMFHRYDVNPESDDGPNPHLKAFEEVEEETLKQAVSECYDIGLDQYVITDPKIDWSGLRDESALISGENLAARTMAVQHLHDCEMNQADKE